MGRATTKYKDATSLRGAVMEVARNEWLAAAGRELTEDDKADFKDYVLSQREKQAIEAARRLVAGIASVTAVESSEWLVSIRGRVVSLLTDPLEYWKNFGLRTAAGSRTMACASLLLGCFPQIDQRKLTQEGMSARAVIEKETACIRAARSDLTDQP